MSFPLINFRMHPWGHPTETSLWLAFRGPECTVWSGWGSLSSSLDPLLLSSSLLSVQEC